MHATYSRKHKIPAIHKPPYQMSENVKSKDISLSTQP